MPKSLIWRSGGVVVMRGDHHQGKKRIQRIVKLYSKYERYEVNNYKYIYVAYIEGLAGGFVIDNGMQDAPHVGRVLFAAFKPEDTRKGHAKRILKTLPELTGIRAEIIELNQMDNRTPWEKLGFTEHGMLNLTQVLSTKDLNELLPSSKQYEGGLPMDVLNDLFRHQGLA